MVNDTRFDDYSLYTQPPRELINFKMKNHFHENFLSKASESATCISSVGMFILTRKRSNYSVAHEVCSKALEMENYKSS